MRLFTLATLALLIFLASNAQPLAEPSAPLRIACTPVRIPPTKLVQPLYPLLAKRAGIEGKVILKVLIAKDGFIKTAEVVSGHPFFNQATRDAILQWRYKPVLLNDKPVGFETAVSVIYE